MKRFKLTIFLLLSISILNSQTITGTIKTADGEPVKYATIYIDELQTGTSANHDGNYLLTVPAGTYHVGFRSLGYAPHDAVITVNNSNIVYNVELQMQSYILQGVTVRADAEDPAYAIIRKVIARAPGFVNQAALYKSNVYIKGTVKIDKIPNVIAKHVEVNGRKPKTGDIYVNESVSNITFEAPDKYVQEVISVNNTFPIEEGDVPVIGLISGSVYLSKPDFFISPFSPNAFQHYKFVYDGLLQDGSWFIDKIKVIPKRKSHLLMEGYLYIVEDLWCLYSYDVTIKPQFVSMRVRQQYAPIKENCFFPVSLHADADIKVLGVKASAVYVSTIKYTDVVINKHFTNQHIARAINNVQQTSQPAEPDVDPKVTEIETKLETLLNNDELTNRQMIEVQKLMAKKAAIITEKTNDNPLLIEINYKTIVNKQAVIRDSVYWDSIRPIPATADEKFSYKKQTDEIKRTDSTAFIKKLAFVSLFGNYEWERSKKFYAFYPGIIRLRNIGFNPVDGLKIMQSTKLRYRPDSSHFIELQAFGGYAFSRKAFFTNAKLFCDYAPKKAGYLSIEGYYTARDFKNLDGAPAPVNAVYNLLAKQNYINQYLDKSLQIYNQIDVKHGIMLITWAKYQQTQMLDNNTNFSFLFPKTQYKPNMPENPIVELSNINNSELFELGLTLGLTFKQQYSYNKYGRKVHRGTKYPALWFNYKGGLPIKTNMSTFNYFEAGLNQHIEFSSISKIKYRVLGGMFTNVKNMHFSSFKHFITYNEWFTTRHYNYGYFLANTYEYSTNNKFFQANMVYSNQFLLLKKLPLISNTYWNERLWLSALYVANKPFYSEFGYSLSDIFVTGEVGVFVGFNGLNFHGVGVKGSFVF